MDYPPIYVYFIPPIIGGLVGGLAVFWASKIGTKKAGENLLLANKEHLKDLNNTETRKANRRKWVIKKQIRTDLVRRVGTTIDFLHYKLVLEAKDSVNPERTSNISEATKKLHALAVMCKENASLFHGNTVYSESWREECIMEIKEAAGSLKTNYITQVLDLSDEFAHLDEIERLSIRIEKKLFALRKGEMAVEADYFKVVNQWFELLILRMDKLCHGANNKGQPTT